MEGAEPNAFGAFFACRFHHSVLHLPSGFVRERKTENVFARERGIGFEQIADALGDHARLAGASAGNHQQRSLAVLDRRALLGV